jgi:hypothetical protein
VSRRVATSTTDADREWVLEHAAESLPVALGARRRRGAVAALALVGEQEEQEVLVRHLLLACEREALGSVSRSLPRRSRRMVVLRAG